MLNRKRRSDRKHVIYTIRNILTDDLYIGITGMQGQAVKRSVHVRFLKHLSRARTANPAYRHYRKWTLYREMRAWGLECFEAKVLKVIRGKRAVHAEELALIKKFKPTLNTEGIING